MKKIVSSVLVCVLLLSTVFVLASCGKTLMGTYENETTGISYEFVGNKVTRKAPALIGGGTNVREGEYSIEDGKITFTFDDDKDNSGTFDFSETTDGDKTYIKIGLFTYYKK